MVVVVALGLAAVGVWLASTSRPAGDRAGRGRRSRLVGARPHRRTWFRHRGADARPLPPCRPECGPRRANGQRYRGDRGRVVGARCRRRGARDVGRLPGRSGRHAGRWRRCRRRTGARSARRHPAPSSTPRWHTPERCASCRHGRRIGASCATWARPAPTSRLRAVSNSPCGRSSERPAAGRLCRPTPDAGLGRWHQGARNLAQVGVAP